MCHYGNRRVRAGIMPAHCILNGLETVPIPPELAHLYLSRQLIQSAKCYQTIVRLGTYTGKVPTYNCLQACKSTMFFLLMPLNKTIEILNLLNSTTPSYQIQSYTFLSMVGQPKVVWHSLVNVNHFKAAIYYKTEAL